MTRAARPRRSRQRRESSHADRSDRDGAGRRDPPAPATGPRRNEPNRRSLTVPSVSMRQLLEAGVHFGHQTRRWNPKMRPFIFAERNGIHIIDLAQTVAAPRRRARVRPRDGRPRRARACSSARRSRPRSRSPQEATRAGQPYVNKRWLGGMLTNFVDDQEAHRPARAARGAPAGRRLRAHDQEGSRQADRGDDRSSSARSAACAR